MPAAIHRINLQTASSANIYAAIEEFTRVSDPIDDRPREGYVLDFKQEWNDSALKTVAAFANTFGGTLIIGVSESTGRPDKLLGVDSPNELKTRIASLIATSLHPCPPFEIGECSLPSTATKRLAIIRVRETAEVCLITKKGIGGSPIYVRIEDQSNPADAAQIRTLLGRRPAPQSASDRHEQGYTRLDHFWIPKGRNYKEHSNTFFHFAIQPTSRAMTRLDMGVEKRFVDSIWASYRGIQQRPNFSARLDRDREWFDVNSTIQTDYPLRWRLTSAGDIAFVAQVCESTDTGQQWSLYDIVAHTVYSLRAARDCWANADYYGAGDVAIRFSVVGAKLRFENGYPANFYDPRETGVPFPLSGALLVHAIEPRNGSSAFISTDYSSLNDNSVSTATELLHQLFRGLGHGVRFETLLESVGLF